MLTTIKRMLFADNSHDTPVIASFYGIKLAIDADAVSKRIAAVNKIKKAMGTKYLLAESVPRK